MSAHNETPIVAIRNISKNFAGIRALHDVNLDIYRGEVLGIVGDNGAGKSTLIKVLNGVYIPDTGTVAFDGRPTRIDHPDTARALGIETVYQDLALVGTFDLADNFFLGRELYKSYLGGLIRILDKARMRDVALQVLQERVGLSIDNPYNPAIVMSGGQRQSIAIGRALHAEAQLVIMDEPTAALGVEEQAKVLEIIRNLKAQGVTQIVISHNLEHVFQVADRIAVMHYGTVSAVCRTSEVTKAQIVGLIMGTDLRVESPRLA